MLLTSLICFVSAIIVFTTVPAFLGPASFVCAGILALLSIILLCAFLKKRLTLPWLTVISIFFSLVSLIAAIYIVIVYIGFFFFHP